MKVILIGAGRLATNLGKALLEAGHDILQVYSRTMESASALATLAGGAPVTEIEKVRKDADVYIISVKDSVLPDLVQALCSGRSTKVFLHTAGSVNMDVFAGMALHYGVFYPMQSFSKEQTVSFHDIPCFVEANDDYARDVLMQLAQGLTTKIYQLSSEDRKYLHLSAGFPTLLLDMVAEVRTVHTSRLNSSLDMSLQMSFLQMQKVSSTSLSSHIMFSFRILQSSRRKASEFNLYPSRFSRSASLLRILNSSFFTYSP